MTLIHTKLNRPPVAENFIVRPQLEELLAQSVHKPLTLVTAPAGYGKSSLVSRQMERCDHPNAWFSLDENDNDPGLFLSYFLTAIQRMFPDAVRETFALVNAPNLPSMSMLATSLINELALIDQPFILVLDDYHLIKEQLAHDLLADLLRYPPASMHLVINSRHDSPLSFTTYRAKGHLLEIGLQDLRFSEQETTAYLSQAFKHDIDRTTAASWQEKTEGWVTGLQLAAISMSHHVETRALPSTLLKDTQYLKEYFYSEVFSKQPPEIQHYLLNTAILDRFNGPLCEVLIQSNEKPEMENVNGWEFISWLKKENLFLIPLDAEGNWYRYHHLFKSLLVNLLSRQCDQEQVALLHSRASEWFAGHDLTEEAILHALAAEDAGRAADLVAKAGFQLMDSQEWPHLKRCLAMIPYTEVEQSPELLIFKAWLYHLQRNLSDMTICLQKVEILKESSQPEIVTRVKIIQGHYDALRALASYMAADGKQALAHSQRACEHVPGHHKRARVFANIFRLGSYQMLGDLETGLPIYQEAMKSLALLDEGYRYVFMANLCFIYWMDADLTSLLQNAECALLDKQVKQLPETASMGHYFLGIGHYCLNDLDCAEKHLSLVVNEYAAYNEELFAYSSFALALIYQARRTPGKARKVCAAVLTHAIAAGNALLLQDARAFTAELALRQGRLAEASQWARQFCGKPFMPVYMSYMPQLTQIKILLAQDTVGGRQQAVALLDGLQEFLTSIHNKVFLIDVLALQALLHEAQDNQVIALETLGQAIDLAEPGGWMRPFLDLGAPMKDLFLQMQKKGRYQDYTGQILAAFGEKGFSRYDRHTSRYKTPETLLTNRELDILKLAGQRLRDKEIAEEVSISFETVKAHMRNIRKKLSVDSRRDAVAKAIELNILPPG